MNEPGPTNELLGCGILILLCGIPVAVGGALVLAYSKVTGTFAFGWDVIAVLLGTIASVAGIMMVSLGIRRDA